MNKIKEWIMALSLEEREKKSLFQYQEKIEYYSNLPEDELYFRYINLKYEHKRMSGVIFILVIVIAIFMTFYISYINLPLNIEEVKEEAKMVFVIFTIMMTLITVTIVVRIIMCIKFMQRRYKELLIIEKVLTKKRS